LWKGIDQNTKVYYPEVAALRSRLKGVSRQSPLNHPSRRTPHGCSKGKKSWVHRNCRLAVDRLQQSASTWCNRTTYRTESEHRSIIASVAAHVQVCIYHFAACNPREPRNSRAHHARTSRKAHNLGSKHRNDASRSHSPGPLGCHPARCFGRQQRVDRRFCACRWAHSSFCTEATTNS
jgi:hypothetical protein